MRVLVASDGHLPADTAAELAVRLAGSDGTVILYTVIEIPRSLLDSLRHVYETVQGGEPPVDTDAEYVGVPTAQPRLGASWPGEDAFLERYVSDQTHSRLDPLAQAVRERGMEPDLEGAEGEDPASSVVEAVERLRAEVLCVGSHGRHRFEGLIGSISTKLVRRSPVPVVVIR